MAKQLCLWEDKDPKKQWRVVIAGWVYVWIDYKGDRRWIHYKIQ